MLNCGEIVPFGDFNYILKRIEESDKVVIDVETDGLQPWHGNRLCGIGVAFNGEEAFYMPFRHPENNLPLTLFPRIWSSLRKVKTLIGHNIKFDLAMLYQDGYRVPYGQELVDTMVAARLCSTEQFADLSLNGQLSEHFGSAAMQYALDFVAYLKDNKWDKAYHKAPADKVGAYCIQDVLWDWSLLFVLEEIIKETHQTKLWEQEKKLTSVLWDMESDGIMYDREYGEVKIPQLQAKIENLTFEAHKIAGREFNIRSGPQLTKAMNELGIYSSVLSPKTGDQSWAKDVMKDIDHPIAYKIAEIRRLHTMLGTYFKKILLWPDDTVHGQLKNWGTITGRLSSAEPNMQNISKNVQNLKDIEEIPDEGYKSNYTEDDTGAVAVRRLFVNRPDHRLYMIDYSQMEIRVFADYLQDSDLNTLLADVTFNFHEYVAERMWDVEKGCDKWEYYLGLAKNLNFGLIYGMGTKALAKLLGCTKEEAWNYKKDYFTYFPTAGDFLEQIESRIIDDGFVANRFRRRYWLDFSRAYVALNYLVQGTSAEIMKNRMIACHKYIKKNNCKSKMLLQVHDELIFDVHVSEEPAFPFEIFCLHYEMRRILQC